MLLLVHCNHQLPSGGEVRVSFCRGLVSNSNVEWTNIMPSWGGSPWGRLHWNLRHLIGRNPCHWKNSWFTFLVGWVITSIIASCQLKPDYPIVGFKTFQNTQSHSLNLRSPSEIVAFKTFTTRNPIISVKSEKHTAIVTHNPTLSVKSERHTAIISHSRQFLEFDSCLHCPPLWSCVCLQSTKCLTPKHRKDASHLGALTRL